MTTALAQSATFALLDDTLARDVEHSIEEALSAGAVFPSRSSPLEVFRDALSRSIRDIERHERGQLVQRFLLEGPYEDGGPIPPEKVALRLSDAEVAATTAFIHSHMVNSFKGNLAELLACAPCLRLIRQLKEQGELSPDATLFVGESVEAVTSGGRAFAQGADLHILKYEADAGDAAHVQVEGVVEVKSYPQSQKLFQKQLARHLERGSQGLRIQDCEIPRTGITLARSGGKPPLRIAVVVSGWKLPRSFRIEKGPTGSLVRSDSRPPPNREDAIERAGPSEWRIVLRWSQEAIASAAYAMTFWYMEKVGEVIYRSGVPRDWTEMTPAKAGKNAVKMMLYYAILRTRTVYEERRAIALYNAYGFGYALGMAYRNPAGRREMLWFEDLQEIGVDGVTREGNRLR